jgi:alpha-tubulin suppressor-like RCC1 family protein
LYCAATLSLVWACSSDNQNAPAAAGGDANTDAGAPSEAGTAGTLASTAGSSNSSQAGAAAAGEAGAGAGPVGGAAGAGGEPAQPECVEASDCVVPETKPVGCAEAQCNEGKCEFAVRDADGDTFLAKRCESLDPDIEVVTGDDCDDADPQVNPEGWDGPAVDGHENGCNDQIDQDCSGIVDDQVGSNQATCTCAPNDTEPCGSTASGLPIDYPILDEVTHKPVGECKLGSRECLPNGTWGACTNAVGPIAEVCDNKNNDCDANTDEDPTNPKQIYCDSDKDNHIAVTSEHQVACKPSGVCAGEWRSFDALPTLDDCDDTDPNNFPGKTEACDGSDNNCDGIVDGKLKTDDLKTTYYQDKDNDTYGTDASQTLACKAPAATGWVLSGGDCQDTGTGASAVHPTAKEICNGKDDDCDGGLDVALTDTPSQPNTDFACVNGSWTITKCPTNKLHCTGDVTAGCETNATAMTSCHACNAVCSFKCGGVGCDEIVELTAGETHACGRTVEGNLACWGGNNKGQLGQGSKTTRELPGMVSALAGVTQASAGYLHTCAVAEPSSTLYCWGDDSSGQLGSSATSTDSATPIAVNSTTGVVSVATGLGHTCAVLSSGLVRCWGLNTSGQVGNGLSLPGANATVPASVQTPADEDLANATQVVAGYEHSCALLSDKTVVCWGDNSKLQLGNAGGDVNAATPVAGLSNVSQLAAGGYYTCALSASKVYCWGTNANLVLGQGVAGSYGTPQLVPSLTDAVAVTAGNETTCVRRSGGTVECWGGNSEGARGDAASITDTTTRSVVGLTQVTQVSAGTGNFACATTSAKKAYCWGANGSYQLGKTGVSTHVPQLLVE